MTGKLGLFNVLTWVNRLKQVFLATKNRGGDLTEVYKILIGKENIESNQFFQLQASKNRDMRGHTLKLFQQRSRLDVRKFFHNFLHRSMLSRTDISSLVKM